MPVPRTQYRLRLRDLIAASTAPLRPAERLERGTAAGDRRRTPVGPRRAGRRLAAPGDPRRWLAPAAAAPTPWRSPPPSPSRRPGSAARRRRHRRPRPAAGSRTARRRGRRPAADLGLRPVEAVTRRPSAASGGPEAAARDARYAALDAAADRLGAAAVLLGHTRDDQAETVLLGLARGSGIRSLSGMAASRAGGRYRRPFLTSTAQTARKACVAQASRPGTTRTTTTPRSPGPGSATRSSPSSRARSVQGSPPPWPGRPSCSRDDADALDDWAALALQPRPAVPTAASSAGAGRPAHRRTHAGCCGAPPSTPAARRSAHRRPRPGAGPAGHRLARPGPARPPRGRGGGQVVWQACAFPPAAQQSMREPHRVDEKQLGTDLEKVLVSEEQIRRPAGRDGRRHRPRLRGQGPAARRRAQGRGDGHGRPGPRPGPHVEMDWMAVSSYGVGHQVLRRGADPQGPGHRHHRPARPDRRGHHRLGADAVLADVQPRAPAGPPASRSAPCCASRTRPRSTSPCDYIGFDIPNEFVIGYGLDYAERYRNVPFVGTLAPHVYSA